MKSLAQEISLFFTNKQYWLGEITIDAVVKESHELRAQISEHPTELGETFVDHVCNLPTAIQIDGIISNTPMTWIGITALKSLNNYINDQSNDIVIPAFKKLEDIFAQRQPITIITSLKNYDNMVLESLSVERGEGTFESLHFKATAKQVCIVKQATIDIPPEPKPERAKPKHNAGKQETKVASPEKQSTLKTMFDGVGKWIGKWKS